MDKNKKSLNNEFEIKDKEIEEIIEIFKIIKNYLKEKEIPEEIINKIFIIISNTKVKK